MRDGLRRWLPLGLTAGLGGITLALLRVVDPTTAPSPLPPCPIHALSGLYCPGCGATRALHALAHADVATALAMNPLLVVALPVLALMLVRAAWPAASLARLPLPRAMQWLWLIGSFTIARNLPWAPFNWLAPG